MDDSSMEMTQACNVNDEVRRELQLLQGKYEEIFQENHLLKTRVNVLENVNNDLENELTFVNNSRLKENSKMTDVKNDLDNAVLKVVHLESALEEEKLQYKKYVKENSENIMKDPVSKGFVVPDQEQLNILTSQIENFETLREKDVESIRLLQDEKTSYEHQINQLQCEKKSLLCELAEAQEHLKQKIFDLQNVKENLESTREEKLLLSTELQILRASDTNASRGNSLFAEVEENRQKVAAQREVLKLKYINLKKVLSQKELESNKLKLELVKIRREGKDDDKSTHQDYCDLIGTYKERISELEERLKTLEQQLNKPQIVISGDDICQLEWVNTVVKNARNETQTLQAELERRGSNYVVQGHRLFDSQKENRKLKATTLKMQSEIDELKMKLENIKSANENVEDGISPPAFDSAIAYQKQKAVTFKEVLHERSNTSLPSDKDSDKEN